ncbi:hypothetical protein GCM10010191_40240 [Actinomadura vinacea]|uniref:Uncharacterized protein n=1 Tax=Actinomadura vinacea TaxID=115336 RepID=A0ABN3J7S6_9ACTN
MPERHQRPRAVRPAAEQRLTVVRIAQNGVAPRVDGSLALAPQAPPEARRRPHLSLVGGRPAPSKEEAAQATVRLVIDVLAGTRPPRQLADRAVPDVWQGLAVHRPVRARTAVAPPRILRTWLQEPTPGVVETGAVVVLNGRVHAVALRLDHHRERWRCTTLETTIPAIRENSSHK